MKKQVIIAFILSFLGISINAQRGFSNALDEYHSKGAKSTALYLSIGRNNIGTTINFGYSILDNFSLHTNVGSRSFSYRDYSESILELGIEPRYTYSTNDRYSTFIRGFSISGGLGIQTELVKNTSSVILADPYPNITYTTFGLYLEAAVYRYIKFGTYFKQWYGIIGDTNTIGNSRYDIGFGLIYYFF